MLGKDFEQLVTHGYDMRNFAVHTGLTGVMGLESKIFEMIAARSLHGIVECMRGELRIIGHEFGMATDVPRYVRLGGR